jgi:hypothetical protein
MTIEQSKKKAHLVTRLNIFKTFLIRIEFSIQRQKSDLKSPAIHHPSENLI